jgi:hypothetical protein
MANIASVISERAKKKVKIEPPRWPAGGNQTKVIYEFANFANDIGAQPD